MAVRTLLALLIALVTPATASPKVTVCGQQVDADARELRCDSSASLADVAKLTRLTKLDLTGNSALADLAPLARLVDLRELRLFDTPSCS
jgi:hypothetical protein